MNPIYIAAPLFTDEQRALIKRIEDMLDFREEKYFSPREYGNISGEPMTGERMERIFDMNVRMVEECELLIAVTDDFDPGVMFEVGLAFGAGKKVITYSDKGYGANVMIKFATFTHTTNDEELGLALDGHEISPLEAIE